jgi:hypothetical protein
LAETAIVWPSRQNQSLRRMKTEDKILLADLRTKYGLGLELSHRELRDLLRLQGEERGELAAGESPRRASACAG